MFLNKIFIFLIVFLFSQLANAATVYKWADEDGHATAALGRQPSGVVVRNRSVT